MELEDHEKQLDTFEVAFKNKRGVLLVVLCILTWVMCTLELIVGVLSAFNTNNYFKELADSRSATSFVLTVFLVPFACGIGALLMFFQKKIGFWLYAVAQGGAVVYSFYLYLGLTRSFSSGLFFGFLVNSVQIAFIIAYATQMFRRKSSEIDMNF